MPLEGLRIGLMDAGQSLGGALRERNDRRGHEESLQQLQGLASAALSGEDGAMEKLLVQSPQMADVVSNHMQSESDAVKQRIGTLAATVLKLKDNPQKMRAMLVSQAEKTTNPELKEDILDTVNMSDDEMLFDLQQTVRSVGLSEPEEKLHKLGEGELLVGDDGRRIAENKKPSKVHKIKPGESLVDENGKKILDAGPAPVDKETIFTNEKKLRDEYLKLTKPFAEQNASYGRIIASASDPSPAGDLALIFNYMKILDPGSTVREGEFANAEKAGNVPTRIWGLFNKLKRGQRLTAKQRGDFVSRAGKLFQEARNQHERTISEYRGLADRNNLNADNILINRDVASNPTPGLPPGAEDNGDGTFTLPDGRVVRRKQQ